MAIITWRVPRVCWAYFSRRRQAGSQISSALITARGRRGARRHEHGAQRFEWGVEGTCCVTWQGISGWPGGNMSALPKANQAKTTDSVAGGRFGHGQDFQRAI